jgi:1,4-dihydroxy-6-naphthoate synthase
MISTTLSLGMSPCPNDTFIFDALLNGRIDTEGLRFELYMEDVEKLNQRARKGELDITKISFHAFAYLTESYLLLDSGSALGNACGPLLIARGPYAREEVKKLRIAIPGQYTTANFLLGLYAPECAEKREMLFSEIEDSVLKGSVDAGVIIHENRFTYESKGLVKIVDLGEFWEQETGLPIPLGGIAARRNLPPDTVATVNLVLRRSIEYAFAHPTASREFVRAHAQEMSEEVMNKHIQLYVNSYSIDLGKQGRAAIEAMFARGQKLSLLPAIENPLFCNPL